MENHVGLGTISRFALVVFFVMFGVALIVTIPYSKLVVAGAAVVAGVALLFKK